MCLWCISRMLCIQGYAENQLCTERTPCLNITITITITKSDSREPIGTVGNE